MKNTLSISPTYYKASGESVYLCPTEHEEMLRGFSVPLNNEALKIQDNVPILDNTGKCPSCGNMWDLL